MMPTISCFSLILGYIFFLSAFLNGSVFSSMFCGFELYSMVPSICPLETLHNSLSLKQVDDFLASIAKSHDSVLDISASSPAVKKIPLNTYTPAKILPCPFSQSKKNLLKAENVGISSEGAAGQVPQHTSVQITAESEASTENQQLVLETSQSTSSGHEKLTLNSGTSGSIATQQFHSQSSKMLPAAVDGKVQQNTPTHNIAQPSGETITCKKSSYPPSQETLASRHVPKQTIAQYPQGGKVPPQALCCHFSPTGKTTATSSLDQLHPENLGRESFSVTGGKEKVTK